MKDVPEIRSYILKLFLVVLSAHPAVMFAEDAPESSVPVLTGSEWSGVVRTSWARQYHGHEVATSLFTLQGRAGLQVKRGSGFGGEAVYEFGGVVRPDVASEMTATAPESDASATATYRIKDTRVPADSAETAAGDVEARHQVDRLLVFFPIGFSDVTVGRQAISFGPGRLANPTDVFVPWRHDDVFRAERPGVDALRIVTHPGEFAVVDLGVVAGDQAKLENSAGFGRVADNMAGVDVGLMIARFRENNMVGLDIQTNVLDAGAWLEASHAEFAWSGRMRPDGEVAGRTMNRVTAGMDYNLGGETYLAGELIWNDAGATDAEQYLMLAGDSRFRDARIALLGRSYAGILAGHPLTPLLSLNVQMLQNLSDHSLLVVPLVRYSLSNESELAVSIYGGSGAGPAENGLPRSEFTAADRAGWVTWSRYF